MSTGDPLAELTAPDARRALDLWVMAIAVGYGVAALVGLPLYGDGAYYWLKVAGDEQFVVPNLRVGALLAQLPGVLAARVTDDPVLLRHAFSLGYVALPLLSLVACWLLVRRVAPALLLFPLLWLAVHQINFSAVSELLASAHLAWPFVLAAALWPAARTVRLYGWLLGALFLVLHPMAFVPGFGLALGAAWLGWRAPLWVPTQAAARLPIQATAQAPKQSFLRVRPMGVQALRWAWLELAAWLAATAALRFGWTLTGVNRYERSNLTADGAAHYLLPDTTAQGLLLAAAALLGLLAAATLLLHRRIEGAAGNLPPMLRLVPVALTAALLGLALWVGGEFLLGQGIKLKAALTFVLGLMLMFLAALSARALRARGAADAAAGPQGGAGTPVRLPVSWLTAPAVVLLILLAAKSASWWTATNALGRIVAEADGPCIVRTEHAPPSLQWRWMRIVDEWPVGIHALAFRPRAPAAPEVSLLLPNDGCAVLRATGEARLQSWIIRPWTKLDERFGPLRRLPGWD
jgi:hypothetical protein